MTDLLDIVRSHGPEAALELLLLRQRVSGLKSQSELEAFLSAHPILPDKLAERMSVHHLGSMLLPLLPSRLATHPDMTRLGQSVAGRGRYNILLLAEMLRIQGLCSGRGLEVIFTKGVLLSSILCGDYTSRTASDLDILVRMEDFMRVRELVIADGYLECYPFPEQELTYFLEYQREAAFTKTTESGVKLHVELQWSVLPAYYRMPYGNEYFFRHSLETRIGQSTVRSLAPTQHLLLLLAHHGAGDLWRNLRHLADIALFVKEKGQEINWPELEAKTNQWGIRKTSAIGFAMAEALVWTQEPHHFGVQIQPSLLRRCVGYALSVPMLPKQRTHRATFLQQLRLCDSGRDQLALFTGYLKRYASPGMDELALVRLPRILFPAYLLIRQFRFLYRGRMSASHKHQADGR
jgi:hypothetical protein